MKFFITISRWLLLFALLALLTTAYVFFHPYQKNNFIFAWLSPTMLVWAEKLNLVLEKTSITDTRYTYPPDIQKSILSVQPIERGMLLTQIQSKKIKIALEQLPMIKKADVRINYAQHQLTIRLMEKTPIAQIFLQNKNYIITADGYLHPTNDINDATLVITYEHWQNKSPNGENLVNNFIPLYQTLQGYSLIADITSGAEWVSERRWRIFLNRPLAPPLLVELPEDFTNNKSLATNTMSRLSDLILDENILQLKIDKLDLRLDNQTILHLLSP